MSKSCSRLNAFSGDLNSKPAFCVGDVLISKRFDTFYQVVRITSAGATIVHPLLSKPDYRPKLLFFGADVVILASGYHAPVLNAYRRDKRARKAHPEAIPGRCGRKQTNLSFQTIAKLKRCNKYLSPIKYWIEE